MTRSDRMVRAASTLALACATLIAVTGCISEGDLASDGLLQRAAVLADATGCVERVELHADLWAFPLMAGISCRKGERPVLVRVYETAAAAARALNDLGPLAIDDLSIVAGDTWLVLMPTEVAAEFATEPGRAVLSAEDLAKVARLPTDQVSEDRDFCVRWVTGQIEAWVETGDVSVMNDDMPPELEQVAVNVRELQTAEAERRLPLRAALHDDLWEYESQVSDFIATLRGACEQAFRPS